MTGRTRRALALLLVPLGYACAASGDGGDGGAAPGSDASTGGSDGSGGPSPDAVVLADDGPGDGRDEAAGDDADDAAQGGKSCAGLPDGTPCGAAPDICHDAPACQSGAC